MNGGGNLGAKLHALRLELETLKIYGHEYIDGVLPPDWLKRLDVKEMKPKPVRTTASAKEKGQDDSLAKIVVDIRDCRLCPLCGTRTQTVPGAGNPSARLMFVGEAPGADEDKQGEPFVGRAGQLLTRMIVAMGLAREDVFIANVLKCRPPENRTPLPAEVEKCEPYLIRQIEMIRPEVICSLGAVASSTLLKTETTISKLRGNFHSYHDTPLMPTFHPSYLLRNDSAKKDVWSDLQMVMKRLGLVAPAQKDKA
jgi:DNA polymerase